jgi:DNA-binding MarR family transcriptional regulator
MNAPFVLPEIDQDTWNRYRANLPRHLMGIARHLQSEVMHSLTRRSGHAGLRLSFEPFITLIGDQGVRITRLAGWLGISKQACNQTINQIEQAGYVRREADPGDGRAKVLQLTGRGRRLAREGAAASETVQAQYRALLGEADYAEFVELVDRLCAGLEFVRPVHRVARQNGADVVGALLGRLSDYVQQRLMELTGARGHPRLKMSFAQVLGLIGPGGGRIQQIARIQQVSKQAVGAVVGELEALGYIERRVDPGDARVQLLCFSDAGRQLLADSVASVDELEREFAPIISDPGLARLRTLAAALYAALQLESEVFQARADLDAMARQLKQQLGPQGARELARLLGGSSRED